MHIYTYIQIYIRTHIYFYIFIYIYLIICLFIYLSIYSFIYLFIHLFIHLSTMYVSIRKRTCIDINIYKIIELKRRKHTQRRKSFPSKLLSRLFSSVLEPQRIPQKVDLQFHQCLNPQCFVRIGSTKFRYSSLRLLLKHIQ